MINKLLRRSSSETAVRKLPGVCLQPVLTEYDKDYHILIQGIVDEDGNEMQPMEYCLHTRPKAGEEPRYEKRDQVTLKVAREGIVLLKNEKHVLPFAQEAKINVFGSGFEIGRAHV